MLSQRAACLPVLSHDLTARSDTLTLLSLGMPGHDSRETDYFSHFNSVRHQSQLTWGGGGVDGTTKHGERVDGTTNLRGRWMVQLTWGEGGRQILERVHDYINFEVLQGNLQLLCKQTLLSNLTQRFV